MATSTNSCGICDLRHVISPSAVWCPECDEGFCLACEEHHSLAKATRQHQTILMAKYQMLPPEVLQTPQSCNKHDEKFLLYCKDHDIPCCGKCAIEVHKGCNEVVNLDDIIKNVKTSTSFEDIEETIAEVVDNIKEIHKMYRGNISTFLENKMQIERQIQEIRFKIDTHLNEIQKKLEDELQAVEETERGKIAQMMKTLEEKENDLTKYQNSIANIKQHASDLQTFMSIKQIEQDLANEEEFTQLCLDEVNTKVFTLKLDENVETIMKKVQKFGEIAVVLKATNAVLRERKKKQAQICIPNKQSKPIGNITTRLHDTINTTSTGVRGCCMLPDGRLAFTGFDMLILIKADGSKDFEIAVPNAHDVANGTTDNTVIVSSSTRTTGISIVDLQDRKVSKFFPVKSSCYGLVEQDGHVIFCSSSGLKRLNLGTGTVKTISTANYSTHSYVDTNETNIYVTSYFRESVICYDMLQGVLTSKWSFKDRNSLRIPLGICVDDDDFSFVIASDSVILISPCGKQHRTLLSSSDGLSDAQALHYDKQRDILIVANGKEKAFLYKIDRK